MDSVVPRYVAPGAVTATQSSLSAAQPSTGRASFDGERSRTPSRPATPNQSQAQAAAGGDEVMTEESTLRQLTVLVADVRLLDRKVVELFDDRIRSRLPATGEEAGHSSRGESAYLLKAILGSAHKIDLPPLYHEQTSCKTLCHS